MLFAEGTEHCHLMNQTIYQYFIFLGLMVDDFIFKSKSSHWHPKSFSRKDPPPPPPIEFKKALSGNPLQVIVKLDCCPSPLSWMVEIFWWLQCGSFLNNPMCQNIYMIINHQREHCNVVGQHSIVQSCSLFCRLVIFCVALC